MSFDRSLAAVWPVRSGIPTHCVSCRNVAVSSGVTSWGALLQPDGKSDCLRLILAAAALSAVGLLLAAPPPPPPQAVSRHAVTATTSVRARTSGRVTGRGAVDEP